MIRGKVAYCSDLRKKIYNFVYAEVGKVRERNGDRDKNRERDRERERRIAYHSVQLRPDYN